MCFGVSSRLACSSPGVPSNVSLGGDGLQWPRLCSWEGLFRVFLDLLHLFTVHWPLVAFGASVSLSASSMQWLPSASWFPRLLSMLMTRVVGRCPLATLAASALHGRPLCLAGSSPPPALALDPRGLLIACSQPVARSRLLACSWLMAHSL